MKAVKIGKAMSFPEMLEDVKKRNEEAQKYVAETGLCFACKKNPVRENDIRCQECVDKTEEILKGLRGTPGFFEGKVK